MKKRILTGALCLILCISTIAGCGKENGKEKADVDINMDISEASDDRDILGDSEDIDGSAEDEQTSNESTQPEESQSEVEQLENQDDSKPEESVEVKPEEPETSEEGQDEPQQEPQQEPQSDESQSDESQSEIPAKTPLALHGELYVDGTQLMDCNGEPMQLRGVSTAGLSWFPQFANKDAFKTMYEEWGINVIRLAMYTDEYAGYCVGDDSNRTKLKDLVKSCVEAAADLGIYVIVDWHVLRDEDPNKYKDQAITFFDEMSELYADYDNVIYEICNEPNGGVTWSKVKSYAEEVIATIRNHDDDAVIIVGTPTWSQDVDKAAADPIKDYDNIMYALHFYAATHKEDLRNRMVTAIQNGLPVFVSEFGICDASGNGGIDYYQADEWIRVMNEYGVSYCVWNLSNKDETSSLLKSSTNATFGWTESQLSASGKWFVETMQGTLENLGTSGSPGNSNEMQNNSQQGNQSGNNQNTDNQNQDSSQSDNGGYTPSAALSCEVTQQNCRINISSANSWSDGSAVFYQLSALIENQGTATRENWAVTVVFTEDVTVDQFWCCKAEANGTQLKITPESWNATINAGNSLSDIGVIVSTASGSTIEQILFE